MSPTNLSITAQAVLAAAAAHADHFVSVPARLPVAARRAVVLSMLNASLLEEVPASEAQDAWRTTAS